MNPLPVNRILFIGIEFPSATSRIPPKNVVHQVVVHTMQVGDIISTCEPMPWVFNVPRQNIDPQHGDFAKEPIRNSDSSNSIPRRSQLLPFEFADVRCRQNRFDLLRGPCRMVDGSSNDSDAPEATDVVVSLV